jgi:hypothetical protein
MTWMWSITGKRRFVPTAFERLSITWLSGEIITRYTLLEEPLGSLIAKYFFRGAIARPQASLQSSHTPSASPKSP